MRLAIDIWEAARNGDVGRLERVIHWTEDGSGVRIESHPELTDRQLPEPPAHVERAWIASTHLGDDVLGRFVRGDLVKPALHYVQSKINAKLEDAPRRACSGMPSASGSACTSSPGGLIGALWLQFARAVERDSQVPAVRRVRHLVRARARHGARRQALLLHALPDQGLPQAAGGGSAAARRGALDRGHRPRAGQRSRHRARLDRAQAWLRAARPKARPNSGRAAAGWARTPVPVSTISIAASPAPMPWRPTS